MSFLCIDTCEILVFAFRDSSALHCCAPAIGLHASNDYNITSISFHKKLGLRYKNVITKNFAIQKKIQIAAV